MIAVRFSSARQAAQFAEDARKAGWRARNPRAVDLAPRRARWAMLIGGLVGLVLLGLVGLLAEAGIIGLNRLEPLFASPLGAVTLLLAIIGAGLGALIGALLTLRTAPRMPQDAQPTVTVAGTDDREAVEHLAQRHGGEVTEHPQETDPASDPPMPMTPLKWLAWGIAVLTGAVLLVATSYIWLLSMDYGHGSDQRTRLGYTLKNVQRIPANTPAEAGTTLAGILGGATRPAPADPLAAAVLAPQAAAQGQTLVYGAVGETADLYTLAALGLRQLRDSRTVVVVADTEPAYALPAAYAAAQFGAPVVPVSHDGLSTAVRDAMQGLTGRQLLIAAPARLIPDDALREIEEYGTVIHAANDDLYRHALLWVRGRWGNFGWGMDERQWKDFYGYFTLANPADPEFAAAGLPTAYRGNYGPLLYTGARDLAAVTDQYLWRLSPDFFVVPNEGPFMNLRVVGSPESVSYNAQARADLGTEVHQYRNQRTGLSGLAALGWAWFFLGLFGAVWALFALPRRVPETMFFPRLNWPLAILALGPLGLLALFLAYQGRPPGRMDGQTMFVRPLWAQALSATIMGIGIGMPLMIASMYLFQLNGMPLLTWFAFTPVFWLGSPMFTIMWLIMVLPAILLSTFLFMGPMMASMREKPYRMGVRMAWLPVTISMVTASLGMFTLIWYWLTFHPLMGGEDMWLWVAPIWWGAVMGFLTALIPNYLLARAGWKHGGM